MTKADFDMFLLASAGLCVLMAVFNLVRFKKRGTSAYLLAGAFLSVGGALLLYRSDAEKWLVGLMGTIAFLFLVGDFAVRARDQVPPGGTP